MDFSNFEFKHQNQANHSCANIEPNHPRFSENRLTPVRINGQLVRWTSFPFIDGQKHFKLIGRSGTEYTIVADSRQLQNLEELIWRDVQVSGLLNFQTMNLIAQKVFPIDQPTILQKCRRSLVKFTEKFYEKRFAKPREQQLACVGN